MNTSITNDAASRTVAMAVASRYEFGPPSSSRLTIKNAAISVLNGMLPDTKITLPYSPNPRANASAKPVRQAGHDRRQRDAAERLPAARAEQPGRFFRFRVERFQHRLERSHHEREADEHQHQHNPQPRIRALDA